MPERKTIERARRDKREGKAPSTQAGEFIREEMHHIREGKHGAKSSKQAIAIGLSKARRAGVDLKPPSEDKTSPETRAKAQRDYARGHGAPKKRATTSTPAQRDVLKKEGRSAASHKALSRQARSAAAKTQPRANGPPPPEKPLAPARSIPGELAELLAEAEESGHWRVPLGAPGQQQDDSVDDRHQKPPS